MEKGIFDELPEFDRLVAGSRFEALAADAQAVVVKYMTPGEFNEMHDLVMAEKEEALRLRNAIGNLAGIKAKLMADLASGNQSIVDDGAMAGSPEGKSSPDTKSDIEGYSECKPLTVNGSVITSDTKSTSPVGSERVKTDFQEGKRLVGGGRIMAGRPEGRKAQIGPEGSAEAYWLTRRVPLYQATIAASLLILLLLAFLLPARFNTSRLAVTDTVYIEKTVRITDTVWLPDDRDGGSTGHAVSDPGTAGYEQESSADFSESDADQPGMPGNDVRHQVQDGLARTTTSANSHKGDAVQPGMYGDYARRQMADAFARIAPLASGRPGNSFTVDADLIRLVAVQY